MQGDAALDRFKFIAFARRQFTVETTDGVLSSLLSTELFFFSRLIYYFLPTDRSPRKIPRSLFRPRREFVYSHGPEGIGHA